MIFRIKNIEKRKENHFFYLKWALFSLLFFLISSKSVCQDSLPIVKDTLKEKELNFQPFFFKALSEKAIGNHQKAIENLESCNQLIPNNIAVFFEFSKNYLKLNKTFIAKEYINRALLKDPNNIWMLKHLVKICVKENDIEEAINVQQKLVAINLKEREHLVKLYLQNNDSKKAIALMNLMEREKVLSAKFRKLKNNLENQKKQTVTEEKKVISGSLKEQFKNNKSFAILKRILTDSKTNIEEQLKYAETGILYFPAQPFVYLVKGKALNYQKKYKKALLSLQNGIDFVIEDEMEADFYKEMAVAYKGLNDFENEKKCIEKSKKI